MIPGMNLLSVALSLITPDVVDYERALTRVTGDTYNQVVTFDSPVAIEGSFQPVPRNLYTIYGLNPQKDYFTFYTLNDIIDIQRDIAADQIVYQTKRFQCLSANNWFAQDGWKGILCVLISGEAE